MSGSKSCFLLGEVANQAPLVVDRGAVLSDAIATMVAALNTAADAPAFEAASCIFATKGHQLAGMLSLQKAMQLAAAGADLASLSLAEAMESPCRAVSRSAPGDVLDMLALVQQGPLPVVEANTPVAVVTQAGLHQQLPLEASLRRHTTAGALEPALQATAATSAQELAGLMAEHRAASVVIMAPETAASPRPMGVVNNWDILRLQAQGLDLSQIAAGSIMAPSFPTATPEHTLWQCQQRLRKSAGMPLLVLDTEQRLLGTLTLASLLQGIKPLELVQALWQLRQQTRLPDPEPTADSADDTLLKQVVENIPDVVFLKSAQTGEQLYVNTAYEAIYSRSREESYRSPDRWLEAIHPDDRDRILLKLEQQRQGQAFFDDEYRVILADGSVRWIWDRSFPIYNSAGEYYRYAGINRDITERKQLELALLASQEHLQLALNLNQLGWWTWGLETNAISWSDQTFLLLGYEPHSLEPSLESWFECIHPNDQAWVEATVNRHRHSLETVEMEYRVVNSDGSIRWILSRSKGIQSGAGTLQLMGILLDITERKRYQAQVRSQAQIIDQVHDAVVVTDFLGQVRFWSQGAERLFGYRTSEMLGRFISHIYPVNQQNFLQHQVIEPLLKNGRRDVEIQLQQKSGQRFWAHLSLSLQTESGGAAIGIISYILNITERKQTEIELKAVAAELQQLYDEAPCGYHSLDAEGCLVRINQTELNMLGYERDEVLGRRLIEFLAPESRESFELNFAVFKQQGWLQNLELFMVRKDGSLLPVSLSAIAVTDADGQFVKTRSIVIDISERVQLESARHAAEVALRISESQRRQALNLTQIGWWDWNLTTNRQTWSDYTYWLLGYAPGEVVPSEQAWRSRIHPRDLHRGLNVSSESELEYRVIHPDHSLHWLLVRLRKIHDRSGQLVRLMGIVMDITERKQAQLALERSEQRMRLALVIGQMGTWQYDPSTALVHLDRQMLQIWGEPPTPDPLPLAQTLERIHPQDRDAVARAIDQALDPALERTFAIEFRIVWNNGSERWITANGQVLFEGEGAAKQATSFFGTAKDVTERKQAETTLQQQLRRERLVSELTRSIRQTLDLDQVLQQTVMQMRRFLQTDRVILLRFDAHWCAQVVTESVADQELSMLSQSLHDPCFSARLQGQDISGFMSAIADVRAANLTPCHRAMLDHYQVRANLVVPIHQGRQIWGLLVAHSCRAPRIWHIEEMELLLQLADQLSIAIRQSELYQHALRELQQRRRAQAALAASEARFRSLSTSAPIAIGQINTDGECLYVNPCWEQMSGLSLDKSLGSGWLEAVHPQDQDRLNAEWQNYLQTGEEFHREFRLLTVAKEVRWVVARVAPILGDEGHPLGHVSIIEDITERRQAEQKIRQQAALLDVATDAILVRDLQNQILFWSQGAERLYGWSASEACQCSATDLFDPGGQEILQPWSTVQSQGTWQGELSHITRDGRPVLVESRWTLVDPFEAGEAPFILTVNTDISEKKQFERQFYRAQRLESLGILASGIAHDLNNVFTPILSISQLLPLQLSPQPENIDRMLMLLQDSTRRGIDMVKQVLTFARGQEGRPIPLQVNAILAEIVKLLRDTLPKAIKVEYQPAAGRLPLVVADSTQLHQVIMNLCVNARDAMAEGGTLTLSTSSHYVDEAVAERNLDAHEGTYVLIAIADTGAGIPSEVCDRIFEPFFTTKPQGQGTGLGLSTSLGIIQNLGGFMRVSSQLGAGTVFNVYLPASQSSAPEQSVADSLLPQGQGETILIVDDELIVQQTTQTLLEEYGYRTLTASDGLEALDRYTAHQSEIAVVLMDMMMPSMDGPTASRALQRLNPAIKILAASGLSSNQSAALAAGAHGFISKPYSAQALLVALRELLD